MKKILFITIFLILGIWSKAQTIHHKLYTTYFNPVTHQPDSVSWDLTAAILLCGDHFPRLSNFTVDPLIKGTNFDADYSHGIYDRGHQMPAEDNSCDTTGERECFYYSNMVPQLPSLNRGTWKELENYARTEALKQPIHIICGVKGSLGTFGKHHVNIPAYCWKKLIYRDSIQYYVMPNQDTVKLHPYTYYRVKI